MGLDISRWYYCPHHPDFTGKCSCRKPEPGMLLQAIEDYKPKRTVFIGDKNTDLLAAEKAEIEYVDIKDVSLFTV
jgi:D-glycero-D-manno-heptose 1,7-bisphosphate phosphatase